MRATEEQEEFLQHSRFDETANPAREARLQIAGSLLIIAALTALLSSLLHFGLSMAIVTIPSALAGGTFVTLVLSIARRSGHEAAITSGATLLIIGCAALLLPTDNSGGGQIGMSLVQVPALLVPIICALCGAGILTYSNTAR